MKYLLVIGAGGYGRNVKEIAAACGYEEVDFLDDGNPAAVGTTDQLERFQSMYERCVVAVGNPVVREALAARIQNPGTLVHPTAVVSPSAELGSGCVIEANAVVGCGAKVGAFSYVCAGAVVNHDATVGAYCQVDCNAVVASGTKVPAGTKVCSCTVWTEK